ncbi:amino acid permease-domain-containing protein [Aspergillus filifer]
MFGIGKEKDVNTTLSPAEDEGKGADPQDTGPRTQVGGLEFNEYTRGGLDRHFGVFFTILLMFRRPFNRNRNILNTIIHNKQFAGSVGAELLLWFLGLLLADSGLAVWLELGLSGCIVFASNMVLASGKEATEWEERGIAIGVISFITLLHVFFPNAGIRGTNAIGVIKIVLLVFIVVTGWVVLSGRVSSVQDPYASFHTSFAGSATSSNLYATALFKVFDSFAGYEAVPTVRLRWIDNGLIGCSWSNAAYVLNEIHDTVRTLKIAAPTGLSICGVLYLLANVAYYTAATPEEIANSGTTSVSVLVAISAFGNFMTVTFAQARVNQELAKEGVIPSLIVIVAIPFGDAYNFILDLEGYPSSIINFAVVAGLFYLAGANQNSIDFLDSGGP